MPGSVMDSMRCWRLAAPASMPIWLFLPLAALCIRCHCAGMESGAQSPITGVRVLVTGGTIDKIYDAAGGRLGFELTQVLEMLRQGRVALPEECVQTVLLKDSLEMDDADRAAVAAACQASNEDRLIIT